jgi:hypothetical protein
MRAQLVSALTSAISTLTNFAVSQELPWEQNGQPLYLKNMKKVYVDRDYREESTMFAVIGGDNVIQDIVKADVFLAVDAKNSPAGLDTLITKILSAKDTTAITAFKKESDYSVDKQEDVLIYTFEFRFTTIKQ